MKKVTLLFFAILFFTTVKTFSQDLNTDTLKLCTILEQPGFNDDKAAILKKFKWIPEKTIRVKFLDGDGFIQAKVKEFAVQWNKYSSVKFKFVNSGNAEIRISFKGIGSWSLIGNSSVSYSVNIKTGVVFKSGNGVSMNFGWFNSNTPDMEFSRVVLHEFGHALGLIHEHQSPAAGIPWDKKAVYAYYKSSQNWTTAQVDRNIFYRYSKSKITNSKYDKLSIMHYAFPAILLTNPSAEIGWNTVLSKQDISFIIKYYIKPKKVEVSEKEPGKKGPEPIGR